MQINGFDHLFGKYLQPLYMPKLYSTPRPIFFAPVFLYICKPNSSPCPDFCLLCLRFHYSLLPAMKKEDAVDVSHIKAKSEIVRFDQDLFSSIPLNGQRHWRDSKVNTPISGISTASISCRWHPIVPCMIRHCWHFVKDGQVRRLYDTTQVLIGGLDDYQRFDRGV